MARKMKLLLYNAPEDCYKRMFRLRNVPPDLPCFGGCDERGKPVPKMSLRQIGDMIRREGFWAFTDTRKKVIHAWIGPAAADADLLMLFGHEIGHTLGKPLRGAAKEEWRADEYGVAAVEASRLLNYVREKVQARS